MTALHTLVFDLPAPERFPSARYTVMFRMPANMAGQPPEAHPSFKAWRHALLDICAASSDTPFQGDAYARKVALATLMNDINDLNSRFPLHVSGGDGYAAITIAKTGHDTILLDFTVREGEFIVREAPPAACPPPRGPRP